MSTPITTPIGRVQPRYCGEYNSSLNYEKLDNVLYDGCTYVALKNVPAGYVPGQNPSYWQLIASKGGTGGFGTPTATASTLGAGEEPSVKVTTSGPDTAKIFDFEFGIPAGPIGPRGFDTISAGASALPVGVEPTVIATRTEDNGNINLDFQFGIPAAEGQGAISVDNVTLDQNRNVNLTAVRAVQGQMLSEDQKGYARDNIGAVPTSRTINGKRLASDITLAAADVGAVPAERTINGKNLKNNITLNAADVGALATSGGTMQGTINMDGQPISGLIDPTEDTQAARKGYVDAAKAEVKAYTDTAKAGAKAYTDEQIAGHTHSLDSLGAAAAEHTHSLSDISGVTVTATEINRLSGVTDNIQTQINNNYTIATSKLNASEKGKANGVATLDGNGKVTANQASSEIVSIAANTTLSASHIGKFLTTTSTSAITITVPNSSDIPVGSEVEIYHHGAGAVYVQSDASTYVSFDGKSTASRKLTIPRFGAIGMKKVTTSTWKISGEAEG